MIKAIKKRDGRIEEFKIEKISKAISKAFKSINSKVSNEELDNITDKVVNSINEEMPSVEEVQDLVEKALMELNYFECAKSYILYRNNRKEKRANRDEIASLITSLDLRTTLKGIEKDFSEDEYDLSYLLSKFKSFLSKDMSEESRVKALIKAAVELTSIEAPKWEFIAARLYIFSFNNKLRLLQKELGITSLYSKIQYLVDNEVYGTYLLEKYTKEEIDECEKMIVKSRDKLISYSSFELILKRYLAKNQNGVVLEGIQEMWLTISMHLAMNEKDKLYWVKRFYESLSKLEFTLATPTMGNARKPFHQLSSCFIDTVGDSLDGIFKSITNFATVSKYGGGMGLYFGKVRANGSTIRGYKGAAGGIIRWIRIVNDVAVAVDQLGVRAGAVACYLDVWHKDLPEFLQIRTNNGDDRMKAHDVFPAICYPDYFWRLARDNINSLWYLMDPKEVFDVKGYHIEDYFGKEWENKYFECVNDERIHKREIPIKEIVRLIIKSAVETGTPFAFNRDIVNETNPNKHQGIIYCSNLCTEIAQNTSAIGEIGKTSIKSKDGDDIIVEKSKCNDFVVCNLASLCLGNFDVDNNEYLKNVVETAIRALDNVIDINLYPLEYAKLTTQKYRSIGLGVSGYNHLLAKKKIYWESEEHLNYVDSLFENINYYAIEASKNLAKEKGKYSLFTGSDWDNGNYFTSRNYTSDRWVELAKEVHEYGIRNGYLLAVAPTSSTSIIAGTTAGVDPIMKTFFYEEKKGEMIPRVAPELRHDNIMFYKPAHEVEQIWSVRAAGVRQRHVDQAQSVNLYITHDYSMRQILELYIKAWENGVKTIYYVRSKALEVEECEGCAN